MNRSTATTEPPERYRPQLSQASAALTYEVTALDERGRRSAIHIPAERPLTVYVDKRELVTLMTLGGAPEALTLGYLRNQRLVRSLEDIVSVQVDWSVDAVAVVTRNGIADVEARTAKKVVTTGCGQGSVFGGLMDEVGQIVLPLHARLAQSTVYRIVETIRTQQSVYKQAGSVHGCALFDSRGELLWFIEDVGRHNAVDAIAGLMWLEGVKGEDKVFYTTGRLTSEMVIKGAQMGIPFLLSRSGTTEMGHRVAEQVGMSLLARCSGRHFLLLNGAERVVFEPEVLEALEAQLRRPREENETRRPGEENEARRPREENELRRPREGGGPSVPASTQLTQNLGSRLRGNDGR